MDHKLAIIDLRAGGAGADTAIKPLMLQPMLFCPVLSDGCVRSCWPAVLSGFLLSVRKHWRNEEAEALHDISGVSFYDRLEEAFSAAEGDVIVVPGPVVPAAGEEARRRLRRRRRCAADSSGGEPGPDRLPCGGCGHPHALAGGDAAARMFAGGRRRRIAGRYA